METEKLINILEDLKEVRTKTKSKVSDEVLFQQGVDIYISEKINESYDRQGNKTYQDSTSSKPISSPATQSQKKLMDSLKIKYNINISKKEAQKLISEKLQ